MTSNLTDPIQDYRDLVAYLEAGKKEKAAWRIGTEHEKLGFHLSTLRPLSYEDGIVPFLEKFQGFGWEPIFEDSLLMGLKKDGCSITLEPGGQIELSGAPLETLHQTCDEINEHLRQARSIGQEMDIGLIGLGFEPKWPLTDVPKIPKLRYQHVRSYMAKQGVYGVDMMHRSCGVQVNLDFESEADMVDKLRVGSALQPIATALFANSPFTQGTLNHYQSYRAFVWQETDPQRCSPIPFIFEDGFGFERYVEYALDVPMYFVIRPQGYLDATGLSFRDFLNARLPILVGERPSLLDWNNHLTTLYPDVRLKQYLEIRNTDAGRWRNLCALPAFWVGLLYDSQALQACVDLIKDWSDEERRSLAAGVPRQGLDTPFRRYRVKDIASEVLTIAQSGLKKRNRVNVFNLDETHHLDILFSIVASGITPAQELINHYQTTWKQTVDPVFSDYAY